MPHETNDSRESRPVTADDVARRAGVSRTAVSYVLNERGTRNAHVSEKVRTRVLQAAQELSYSIDTVAQALSRGHSDEICLITEATEGFFGFDILTALQMHARDHGYTTLVHLGHGGAGNQRRRDYQRSIDRRPLALLAPAWTLTGDDIAYARRKGVKYIFVIGFAPCEHEGVESIVLPYGEMAYLAAKHLIERGCDRLAIINHLRPYVQEAFALALEGMRRAAREHSLGEVEILPLESSPRGAYRPIEAAFATEEHPTGIYALSDSDAALVQGALLRRGLRVPQDVALVGSGNLTIGEVIWPALTSIRPGGEEIGRRVVEIIVQHEAGTPLSPQLAQPLKPALIVRESS